MADPSRADEFIAGVQLQDTLNAAKTPGYHTMPREDVELFGKRLMHFSDTERMRRWNKLISSEAFLAYAAKGFQDSTGVELPVPELIRQISLYVPLLTIPVGVSLGKSEHKMHQLNISGDKSSNLDRILDGVEFTALRTLGAGAVGYALGYGIGYYFSR